MPAKVKVPPKLTGDVLLPSETVIELFVNDELPIFVNVLSAPLIVLFVSVVVEQLIQLMYQQLKLNHYLIELK